MKIIIIGSIAAGVSAAARLAAAQRGAQITVYEKGGFYSCGTAPWNRPITCARIWTA